MADAEPGKRFPGDPDACSQLERGFRRLLRAYPAAYRQTREEEMLATLMESSAPGQRRPSFRDTVDLALGAARAHLKLNGPPAPGNAIQAAALPAALLLASVLMLPVVDMVVIGAMGYWPLPQLTGDPFPMPVSVALHTTPMLVGVVLAIALFAQQPRFVRRLAAFSLPLLVSVPALIDWHVTGLLEPRALVPAMLAAVVAAAPLDALKRPRRRLAVLALATVALPILSLLAQDLIATRLMTVVPPESTPDIVFHVSSIGLVAGLLMTGVFLAQWRHRGAVLATLLLGAATLPVLAEKLDIWWSAARLPMAYGTVSFVLAIVAAAALHRRATSRRPGSGDALPA
jgi:hypothetical protein